VVGAVIYASATIVASVKEAGEEVVIEAWTIISSKDSTTQAGKS